MTDEWEARNTGIRERVARGGAWLFGARAVEQAVRWARLIVLARLLAPQDFGLMGVALLTMSTLQTFTESGFHVALVRRREAIRDHLNTAWTIAVIRGAALFVVLTAAAPSIAGFFNAPGARWIIQALGISLLIQGLFNSATVYFQRELQFRKQVAFQLSGAVADGVVAVIAAVVLRNAWALVLGFVAGDVVRLCASYLIADHRPRFELDRRKLRELWGFGKWLTGSSILVFLSTQGDDILVGKWLGTSMLAFYQLAYRISNLPATEFSRLVATVTLPAMAKLQDHPERLRRAYLQVLQFTAAFAFPVSGLLFILAPEFTSLVLGRKWLPMVTTMQVLAVCGMFRAIAAPGPLFLAVGRPELRARLQLIGLIVMLLTIVPLTYLWGIAGTAVAATLRVAVSKTLAVAWAMRETRSRAVSAVRALLAPFVAAAAAVLAVHLIQNYLLPVTTLWVLIGMAVLGAAAYLVIARTLDWIFDLGGARLLRDQLSALVGKSG